MPSLDSFRIPPSSPRQGEADAQNCAIVRRHHQRPSNEVARVEVVVASSPSVAAILRLRDGVLEALERATLGGGQLTLRLPGHVGPPIVLPVLRKLAEDADDLVDHS